MTEIVDVIDKNGKTVRSAPRSEVEDKSLWHKTAAVVVFNSQGQIFVHRRMDGPHMKYPGLYDVKFAGWVKAGETYEKAAMRELEEESGIKASELEFLFEYTFDDPDNKLRSRVYKTVHDGPLQLQETEVMEGRFMSREEAKLLPLSPTGKEVIKRLK